MFEITTEISFCLETEVNIRSNINSISNRDENTLIYSHCSGTAWYLPELTFKFILLEILKCKSSVDVLSHCPPFIKLDLGLIGRVNASKCLGVGETMMMKKYAPAQREDGCAMDALQHKRLAQTSVSTLRTLGIATGRFKSAQCETCIVSKLRRSPVCVGLRRLYVLIVYAIFRLKFARRLCEPEQGRLGTESGCSRFVASCLG